MGHSYGFDAYTPFDILAWNKESVVIALEVSESQTYILDFLQCVTFTPTVRLRGCNY